MSHSQSFSDHPQDFRDVGDCLRADIQVIQTYQHDGFSMLLRAFNEGDYLEHLTGLDKLHEESEAMMEKLDWDGDGAEEEDDF